MREEKRKKMKLIAGLGNPGREYDGSRHNAGFMALDALAGQLGISVETKKWKGLIGQGMLEGEKVLLVKPQTYMNLSGECIRAIVDFYKIEPEDVLVLFDDISLDVGQLRIRKKGSAGGHNGIKSMIACLGTMDFPRIKIGIGEKPPKMDLADYVLGHFPPEELRLMEEAAKEAAQAVKDIYCQGLDTAMNRYNRKKEVKKPEDGK